MDVDVDPVLPPFLENASSGSSTLKRCNSAPMLVDNLAMSNDCTSTTKQSLDDTSKPIYSYVLNANFQSLCL